MMKAAAVKLQLPLAVGTIQVLDLRYKPAAREPDAEDTTQTAEPKKKLNRLCEALAKAVEQINLYGQNLFAAHREKIVHLAVQIAARILAREIEQGHYEMENILAQVIEHAPLSQVVEIRLNPEDLKTCEAWLKNEQAPLDHEIKLVADESIGRAECAVHTPEGIVEYRIEEHLRQIEAAMAKI